MKVDIQNFDTSFNKFHEAINTVLNKHASYDKVKTTDWITASIQTSIKIQNKLFKFTSIRNILNWKKGVCGT